MFFASKTNFDLQNPDNIIIIKTALQEASDDTCWDSNDINQLILPFKIKE
jgi:hypothetical protein